MRILEQLKLEWTGADLQAFRSMWMARMPIPDIAERLGCSAAEVALLVIDQAENGDKSVIVFLLKAGTYCVMPMDIYLNNDYQNEAFFPDFIYGFGYDLFFDNCTPEKYLNIIGNIYENPELLEGNK